MTPSRGHERPQELGRGRKFDHPATHFPEPDPYMEIPSDLDVGVFIGLLVGQGSFGGDGKQPQVSLKMHVRHEALFRWLMQRFPRTRLYGPYHHGGRSYFQWMARGTALVQDVLPLLEAHVNPQLDGHAAARLQRMLDQYAPFIARERSRPRPDRPEP